MSRTAPQDPIPLNDVARAWIATSEEVRQAVERVLASGWFVHGPEHTAFESELAAFVGARHAVGVASGTDALQLALLAVDCGPGSEVVCVANAGAYASIAASRIGCRIVYADVDPRTLVMTRQTLEAAISPTTRAVVVTHLYGNVAELAGIVDLCRGLGVALVEDCAQALGAVVNGRRAGTFGVAAAVSFYPTKNLGAAGDGGAVITNDEGVADTVRSLRQYGWAEKYVIERGNGMNSRLDELQAAILRIGLRRLDALTERRKQIVRAYTSAVTGTGVQVVSGSTPSYVAHLAVIRSDGRDRLRATLREARIATAVHYPVPDHRQPALPPPARHTNLAVSELAADEVLTVPCFPEMTETEVARVRDAIRRGAPS